MKKTIKRKQVKGFTLVELLAVIVILAIILVIAVPKVMNVIEDAKKATLESTAKMIASQAEKQKVQNTVLGKNKEIECKDIVKINDVDYESCEIEFENNTALVTIIGKGKFNGLWVCGGTKTSSVASDEECADNSGVSYIEDLLETAAEDNGLIVDDTDDENIRYVGANPSNKVYFNCKDTYNGKTYGSEGYDYASACETWRIIGVFNVKTNISDTSGTKRIKIVRDAFTKADGNPLWMSWDLSAETINYGWGINEWSQADLKTMLNTYYLGTTNTCTYCNGSNQGTCSNDCTSNVTPLSTTAQNMIGQAVLSTRGIEHKSYTAKEMYEAEQTSTLTGKECTSVDYCNDSVERKAEWEGKIGLIYPSDFGYASTDENCTDITDGYGTCYKSNWMYTGFWYWTVSPSANSATAISVWDVGGYVGGGEGANNVNGVRAATYLNSNIQIIGGNGNTIPYKLSA